MSYKEIRRDLISAFLLYFFLKRRDVILPTSDQAADWAVEYADALINKLNKSKKYSNREGKRVGNKIRPNSPAHFSSLS